LVRSGFYADVASGKLLRRIGTTTVADDPLSIVWTSHERWSAAAGARKDRLDRGRAWMFVLLIAAALLGFGAAQMSNGLLALVTPDQPSGALPAASPALRHAGQIFAGLATLFSAWAGLLGREVISPSSQRDWLLARAVAETLKSEAFKYAARTAPYDGADRSEKLLRAASAIEGDTVIGCPVPVLKAADTDTMPVDGMAPGDYLAARVERQIAWYERRSEDNRRAASRWREAVVWLGMLGAACAAVAAAFPRLLTLGGLVGVMGTVSGLVGSYVATSRFSTMAQMYELTARRLRYLRCGWELVPDDKRRDRWGDFVRDVETTISSEREQWVKEWQRKVADTPAGDDAGRTQGDHSL
jgi:hypothetical protein